VFNQVRRLKRSNAKNEERNADGFGGLLIQETGYPHPILIGDVSRVAIGNTEQKALELLRAQD
jgi:hypothetical protein